MMAPTIAPMALMPSQSPTRRLPGWPASAEALLGPFGEGLAGDPRDRAGQARRERAEGPLEERLLELELLEVLGLHRPELGQAGLDRVDRRAAGEAQEDEQDRQGGDAAMTIGRTGISIRPRCRRSCG